MNTPSVHQRTMNESGNGFLRELVNIALIAALIVLPIRIFVAQPFIVSGSSMDPTFSNGDYLVVDQLTYRFQSPSRGDVVIFKYPKDPSKYFIKRIIGLPGETVTVNPEGTFITGPLHSEPLKIDQSFVQFSSIDNTKVTLDDDEYFVMGDNRRASSDSRVWGAVPRDNIVGRALLRLLPFSEASVLPGDIDLNG